MKRALFQSDNNLYRRVSTSAASVLWIVLGVALTTAFLSCSLAAGADVSAGKLQIQGDNIRIEFDHHLRSRVVASFDKTGNGDGAVHCI